MSKKIIILVSVCVLLLAVGGGYLIVSSKNKSSSSSVPVSESSTTQETAAADLDYSDASGFSFMYPKSLRVDDITPSDDSYYSKVSLTKSGSKLTVTVKDESAKTVDEFLSSDDYYNSIQEPSATDCGDELNADMSSSSGGCHKSATLSGATTLAGISAKEYALDGKLITIALKDGILYLVEGSKDGGFWEDTQGIVVSTFSFGLKSSGSATSDESNTTYEPEEVVE